MPFTFSVLLMFGLTFLAACSPHYNWREVHDNKGAFTVLLPDKPVSMSRQVNLAGQPVMMTMTAAEVDKTSFAVGYAQLADSKLATAALTAMKTALVNNIHATIIKNPAHASPDSSDARPSEEIDIEATGTRVEGKDSEPLLLLGHFIAKGNRAYQVIVLGDPRTMQRQEAETFLSSFQPH